MLRAGRGWRTVATGAATQTVAAEGDHSQPAVGTTEAEGEGEGEGGAASVFADGLRHELDVVSLFADVPSAPFSIQRIAAAGAGQPQPLTRTRTLTLTLTLPPTQPPTQASGRARPWAGGSG